LSCFAGVADTGCQRRAIIADARKPKDLLEFNWINMVLDDIKTSLSGAYPAYDFAEYGTRTSVRLFIVSTGASILSRLRFVYSSLRPLLGLARHVGFAKLKSLPNQEKY